MKFRFEYGGDDSLRCIHLIFSNTFLTGNDMTLNDAT
jgi:hypothetical protein